MKHGLARFAKGYMWRGHKFHISSFGDGQCHMEKFFIQHHFDQGCDVDLGRKCPRLLNYVDVAP